MCVPFHAFILLCEFDLQRLCMHAHHVRTAAMCVLKWAFGGVCLCANLHLGAGTTRCQCRATQLLLGEVEQLAADFGTLGFTQRSDLVEESVTLCNICVHVPWCV